MQRPFPILFWPFCQLSVCFYVLYSKSNVFGFGTGAAERCSCFFPEDWADETFFPTPNLFLKISTLEILNLEDQGALLSDDEIFASRQTGKHTCMALRRYFEAHLAIKLEQVKQSLQRTEGGILVHPQPPYKVRSTLQAFHMVVPFLSWIQAADIRRYPSKPVQ